MSIQKLIQRDPETIRPDASCAEAAEIMRDANVGSLVVCDSGRPLGVLTDRDIAVRVVAEGDDPARLDVARVMSSDPVFLSRERSIDEVVAAMRDQAIRRIPIVDEEGQLEGVVALDDVFLLLVDRLGGLAQTVRKELGPG